MPSKNHTISKGSSVQTVQKQKDYVKNKPSNQKIWKPKISILPAVANPQPKLVHVEVTYKDAQGMPRTCMSWVPDFN